MLFTNWVTRARKKINSDSYYERRLWKIADKLDDWNHFEKFECSEFFRGRVKARINQKKHDKHVPRLKRKAKWYEKKIENENSYSR